MFDEQIIGRIWASDVARETLSSLCKIGSRASCTESEIKGRDYLIRKLNEFELENVHSESYEYQGWLCGDTSVEVVKPFNLSLEAISLVQCPSTSPHKIEGDVIFLGSGTPEKFHKNKDNINGKIVMVTSETPYENGRYVHRREKYGLSVMLGAKAFLYMNHQPGMLQKTGSLRTNAIGEIPAVGISYEEGMKLVDVIIKETLTIKIMTRHEIKKDDCYHVIGEITGKKYPKNIIIVGAHYDSHYISPGAIDNTTGVATVMEIANALSEYKGMFKRTIRFIFYPMEEMGLTGSSLYVKAHEKEMNNIDLVVNFDIVSLGRKKISIQGFPELVPYFKSICEEIGYPPNIDTNLMHNSDHFCFTMMGVPAIYMHENDPYHDEFKYILTKADTLDKVDPINVKELAILSARIVLKVANEENPIAEHKSEIEILQMIENEGVDKFLKITNMWDKFFPWKR